MATEILPATGTGSLHHETTASRFMTGGARILLGFIFFASGVNGVLQLVAPPAMQGNAATFMEGQGARCSGRGTPGERDSR